MKKKTYIVAFLTLMTGVFCTVTGQSNNFPPPDENIPHDKEPVIVNSVNPQYPPSMLSGGWEANVYIQALIDVNGNVTETRSERIEVFSTRTAEKTDKPGEQKVQGKAFEEAVYTAAKQCKFSPAQMQGKPVAVWVTIPFHFKLKESGHADLEKNSDSIQTIIENIFQGTDIEKSRSHIGKSALLIYNTRTVNLLSVLNGEQKDVHLVEKRDKQNVNCNININDGNDMAVVEWTSELPKGKSKRIHTIVLSKSTENTWKIVRWHVSF
ncbi:MAG: energy transducer TonB [Bacteroidota bacterium]